MNSSQLLSVVSTLELRRRLQKSAAFPGMSSRAARVRQVERDALRSPKVARPRDELAREKKVKGLESWWSKRPKAFAPSMSDLSAGERARFRRVMQAEQKADPDSTKGFAKQQPLSQEQIFDRGAPRNAHYQQSMLAATTPSRKAPAAVAAKTPAARPSSAPTARPPLPRGRAVPPGPITAAARMAPPRTDIRRTVVH
jgi:hypothetical protein